MWNAPAAMTIHGRRPLAQPEVYPWPPSDVPNRTDPSWCTAQARRIGPRGGGNAAGWVRRGADVGQEWGGPPLTSGSRRPRCESPSAAKRAS